jgi:RNA polymerase sigma-70 factor (ECF subfamily)
MSADDVHVVAALRKGDERVFATIIDRWSPAMLRYARTFVRSDASAEDVVQETWIAVLRGIEGFRGDASLRRWVFQILGNIGRRRGVSDARTVPVGLAGQHESDQAGLSTPAYPASSFRDLDDPWPGHWRSDAAPTRWQPEAEVVTADAVRLVERELAQLPERQRLVVALRDVHGFTGPEVCELLGLSPENQRVLLHRGRTRIRAALESTHNLREEEPS